MNHMSIKEEAIDRIPKFSVNQKHKFEGFYNTNYQGFHPKQKHHRNPSNLKKSHHGSSVDMGGTTTSRFTNNRGSDSNNNSIRKGGKLIIKKP